MQKDRKYHIRKERGKKMDNRYCRSHDDLLRSEFIEVVSEHFSDNFFIMFAQSWRKRLITLQIGNGIGRWS